MYPPPPLDTVEDINKWDILHPTDKIYLDNLDDKKTDMHVTYLYVSYTLIGICAYMHIGKLGYKIHIYT